MLPDIYLPSTIQRALDMGAALIASNSGGKDGQAMTSQLTQAYYRYRWTGPYYMLHMDLGRAEWPESLPQCQKIAYWNGIRLVVRRRPQGDLIQEITDRMHKVAGERSFWPAATQRYCTSDQKSSQADKEMRSPKPFWPSATNRYCTSDQKRTQGDKELRDPKPFWPDSQNRYCTGHHKTNQGDKELRQFSLVINAQGIRGQESTNRSKKDPVVKYEGITSTHYKGMELETALDEWERQRDSQFSGLESIPRLAITWFPIFDWSLEDVYHGCGHSIEERNDRRELYRQGHKAEALADWYMHPCYVYGNDRCSCVFCILGSLNDLKTGAREHPDLLNQIYIPLEEEGGFTFKNKWSLKELCDG